MLRRSEWLLAVCACVLDLPISFINGTDVAPELPKYCIKSSMAIVCTATDEGTLKQLSNVLLMEVLVDFVFFDTSDKTCSCSMVDMVKSVRETDVVVLTNATCGIEEYTGCGHDIPKDTSVTVAGLVISPSDSKMKWAIKHHVLDLWNKAKVLKRTWQRVNIFRAILKDVSLSVVKLGDDAAKTGGNQLIFGDVPPVLTVEPTPSEVRPVNLNLKEQLWEMDAEKHEKAAKAFSDEVMESMSDLDEFDALVGGESAQGVKTGLAQQSAGDKLEQVNEAVMEANLDNQLAQIKQDLKKKGRRKRHVNRLALIRESSSTILKFNITQPKRLGRFQFQFHKLSRRKREKTVRANIMPFKIFVGGDYASLFDTVAIDLATSMEASLPKNKLLLVQEAKDKAAVPPAAANGASQANSAPQILKSAAIVPLVVNPVRTALLAESGASDDINDITEEDVVDELVDLNDDRNILEEEERRVAQMAKSMANKEVPLPEPPPEEIPEILRAPPPGGAVVIPAAAAAAAATGVVNRGPPRVDSIEEDKRRSKEQDHIFKNFIVFIIAIIGIIIIFAVLVIMSMRRRPSKEDVDFFQKARAIQMWEHEHLMAQRRNIYQNYDGVTPPSSPFAAFKQPNYLGGEFPIGNREQLRPRRTPEISHSDYAPTMNMDPPLLGGRHVITEFDEEPLPNSIVSQRSRSPTWPYHFPRSYLPPPAASSARKGVSFNYFGSELNSSNNNSVKFITSRGTMTPVWELCAESAYLNGQPLQDSLSLQDDLFVAPRRYCRHRKSSHRHHQPHYREQQDWRDSCSEKTVYQSESRVYHQNRKKPPGGPNCSSQTYTHLVRKAKEEVKRIGNDARAGTQEGNGLIKSKRFNDRLVQNNDWICKFDSTSNKQAHPNYYLHHCPKYNQQSYTYRDQNKNGLHYQGHLVNRNQLSLYNKKPGGCNEPIVRHRRRSHRGSHRNRRAVTWIDLGANGETGLNKGENHQMYFKDMSNNWLFGLFSKNKEEDPRKAEERFYGGLESSRLSKLEDSEREKQELEMRFRRAQSPHSTFPQPAIVRPGVDEGVGTDKPEFKSDGDTMTNINVLGVSTNDAVVGKRLIGHRPLPYGSFRTVSLLLESPNVSNKAEDVSVYLTAHDMPPLATRLQPFVPYDTPTSHLKSPSAGEEEVRLPPVQFRPQPDTVKGPLPKPFHHPGVAWPLAFATQPPYTCPGHEVPGVKQPVGVLQTGVVPARPLKARAWELDTEIPAWISPLYKTYGIAGPYGRHGPFAEPRLMQSDARWNELLRQAEGIGALDMPGVITEGGHLDLTGLCGGYVQLRKEYEEMLARQRQWQCKPCASIKKLVRKVKKKLGMQVKEEVEEKDEKPAEGDEALRKSGQSVKSGLSGKAASVKSGAGETAPVAPPIEEQPTVPEAVAPEAAAPVEAPAAAAEGGT